jgi:putative membrane protein
MTLRWIVAALHLLALGIGLGAVWARGRALRIPKGRLDAEALRRAFHADSWWGVAGLLWIATGLWRAFGGLEKGTDYYLHNPAFHAKMGLLIALLLLEGWAATTLTRWRIRQARGETLDLGRARALGTVSLVQAGLVVLMVLAATAMARGITL